MGHNLAVLNAFDMTKLNTMVIYLLFENFSI